MNEQKSDEQILKQYTIKFRSDENAKWQNWTGEWTNITRDFYQTLDWYQERWGQGTENREHLEAHNSPNIQFGLFEKESKDQTITVDVIRSAQSTIRCLEKVQRMDCLNDRGRQKLEELYEFVDVKFKAEELVTILDEDYLEEYGS